MNQSVARAEPELSSEPESRCRRLRRGVELLSGTESCTLVDRDSGLRLVLGADAAGVLAASGTTPAASHDSDAIDSFLDQLAALGLFEPTPLPEALAAQGEYVLRQAARAEAERVRETVERAALRTALHLEHLGPILQANPQWLLEDLPLLRKPDLRRHFPIGLTADGLDLKALLRSRDLVMAATSGTTGERLQVYSDTRISRLPPDALEFWRLSNVPTHRPLRTAIFTSPHCAGATCSSQLPFDERVSFEHTLFLPSPRNPFRMKDQDVRQVLDEMRQFAADIWLVNPVYLAALADRAEACGQAFPPVSAILHSYQYLSHCQRRALRRHFAVPLLALYSATELGGSQIGVGCPEGNLHIRLDQVFVELLAEGRPVSGAELGSVTVTSHNPTMPLVRYALGDLARHRLAPCRCAVGSAWPTLVLEGRERDAFTVRDQLVTTKAVDDALEHIPLAMYQVSETAPSQFRLEAIPERQAAFSWRATAEAALQTLLSPQSLAVEEVSELELDDSQKFRFTSPLSRTAVS